MNKGKVKLVIAAFIFALLVGGGVFFVKDRGLVNTAEKQFKQEVPTEATYTEETEPIDELYIQPNDIWIKNIPNARVYGAFCDANFEGRYIILDRKSLNDEPDIGIQYDIKCVDREEFKRFFEDNVTITTPEDHNIFDEAEMGPMMLTAYMTRSEGTIHEETSLAGHKQKTHVIYDPERKVYDGIIAYPDVNGSEKFLSGIDVSFFETTDYGKHFRDNKLDIVFSDIEIVRLIESSDLLVKDNGAGGVNNLVAIVDATVSCNENDGMYKDLKWIPETGHQNRVRLMMTYAFDISAMENEPIVDHEYVLESLGVYGYEQVN